MTKIALQVFKLHPLLLLLFLIACDTAEEDKTEISGKVTDIETNAPVADVKIDLMVSDGIDVLQGFLNPVTSSTLTNSQGTFTFIFPANDRQKLYLVTPGKTGYLEVKENTYIANQLKNNEKNLHDIKLAKGSYLTLSINRTSDPSSIKTLRVKIRPLQDPATAPHNGELVTTDVLSFNGATVDTAVIRGFFYKRSPSLKIEWDIITNGSTITMESSSVTIPLVEYDTAYFGIDY